MLKQPKGVREITRNLSDNGARNSKRKSHPTEVFSLTRHNVKKNITKTRRLFSVLRQHRQMVSFLSHTHSHTRIEGTPLPLPYTLRKNLRRAFHSRNVVSLPLYRTSEKNEPVEAIPAFVGKRS